MRGKKNRENACPKAVVLLGKRFNVTVTLKADHLPVEPTVV